MTDEKPKHPYNLDRGPYGSVKPTDMDRVATRIEGFIGGGIVGLAIAILVLVVLTKFGFVPLGLGLYGILGSVILFAIIGAFWPKCFAWIVNVLTLW